MIEISLSNFLLLVALCLKAIFVSYENLLNKHENIVSLI